MTDKEKIENILDKYSVNPKEISEWEGLVVHATNWYLIDGLESLLKEARKKEREETLRDFIKYLYSDEAHWTVTGGNKGIFKIRRDFLKSKEEKHED